MEENDNSDVVRLEKYISVMTDVLVNKKYYFCRLIDLEKKKTLN